MYCNKLTEHFVTLFDSNFLPMGLCLHNSMMEHAQPFHLWIICMDALVERQLRQLNLLHVSLIPLQEVETDVLLGAKIDRTQGEYCWTLTSFTPRFVFDRDENISRVTYLDADICFFDSPRILLKEFEASGKDVLITEHGYAPEYYQTTSSGRFCVQFMTFRRTEGGLKVMKWWQERCLEWCFFRCEDGKLGDQKYLDDWPERFAGEVHVLRQVEKTLAPWNVRYFKTLYPLAQPVFYHFHSLRIVSTKKVLLYLGYQVGHGRDLYNSYLRALKEALSIMREEGMPIPVRAPNKQTFYILRVVRHVLLGKAKHASI